MKPWLCVHHVLFHKKPILGPNYLNCIFIMLSHYMSCIFHLYCTFILMEMLKEMTYFLSRLNIGGFHCDFTVAQRSQK